MEIIIITLFENSHPSTAEKKNENMRLRYTKIMRF